MSDDLKTLSSTLRSLEEIDYPDSYRIAKEIVEHFKGNSEKINRVIERLKNHEPWDYIRGYNLFRGIKVKIGKGVLIPRIETEQIIDISKEALQGTAIKTIIDVGTGSGAIIKALEKETKGQYKYVAIEKSLEAIKYAQDNLKATQVNLIQSDLLENIEISDKTLVIANLPYIPTQDYKTLEPSVKEYEPREALDGGENGTDTIGRLLSQCSTKDLVLKILLEIDPNTIDSIEESIKIHLPGFETKIIPDYRGQNRFVLIEKY